MKRLWKYVKKFLIESTAKMNKWRIDLDKKLQMEKNKQDLKQKEKQKKKKMLEF